MPAQEKDMKVDGSLCSLPKSSAFELGVAAIAFLFVAQLVGTTAAVSTVCAGSKPKKSSAARGSVAFVALLVLSWYVLYKKNDRGDSGRIRIINNAYNDSSDWSQD